ncbi:MAG: hypothetical protein R3F49_09915 [Planctomycetota bacterium]
MRKNQTSRAPSSLRARVVAAAPAGVVAVVFSALFVHTYRGWTDVTVDFGRELYVAWRIASGDVLYRDIAWFSGPLSAQLNGLVFRVCGASLTALIVWNTALAILTFGLAYTLIARHTSRGIASVVTSVAVTIFAFGQHAGIGNYNHVTPYSHEAVHGTLLGALALLALHGARNERRGRTGRAGLAVLAGLALAATFATKAEPFAAAASGAIAFVALQRGAERLRLAAGVLAGFSAGFGLALALLALQLPLPEALHGLLGAWPHIFNGGVTEAYFYKRLAGLDRPAVELRTTLAWTVAWLCALAPVPLAMRFVGARLPSRTVFSAALFGLAVAAGLFALDTQDVLNVGRPTALVLAVILLAQVRSALRAHGAPLQPLVERVSWSTFALVLLMKLGLKQTWIFYGFVHALPAFAISAAALLRCAAALDTHATPARRAPGQWWIAGLLVALACVHVRSLSLWMSYKVNEVGQGADRILADGRGDEVAAALAWIDENTAPDATVLVLPEGLSLNYWARRRSPTRYLGFMPTEIQMFGEGSLVRALEERPPDVVLLVQRFTSDYGVRFFGRDYGRELGAWIDERYSPVALFGAMPFTDARFGVLALRPR